MKVRNEIRACLIGSIIVIALAACTQVPTEEVGGRKVKIDTWDPKDLPETCRAGPMLKSLEWNSQTDITSLRVQRGTDGSLDLNLGASMSKAEIAQAMANVAAVQIGTQGETISDLVDSDGLLAIVRAVLAAGD